MADLATLDELKARLDWTLDEDEERIAKSALEDLSDEARFHGSKPWNDPATAPRMVRKMVLAAAVRYLRNPEGYTTSRAGDETLSWNDDRTGQAGSAHFNREEIAALRRLAGATGLTTTRMTAWGPISKQPSAGYIPVGYSTPNNDPFPYYADSVEPW